MDVRGGAGVAGCCGASVVCARCPVRVIAVCGSLAPEQLCELARIAAARRLAAGQVLFDEGAPARDVYTLTAGMLKLFKVTRDGRRQITGFLLPGDFIGLAFADSYVYSAEAVVDSEVCRFRREPFERLLRRYPALEHDLLGRASTEIAAAQEQILLLGRKTARERVASFLLALCERQNVAEGGRVHVPMSRLDIGDYIGTRVETVSRVLSLFCREGVLAMPTPHEIVVNSLRRLRQEAQP